MSALASFVSGRRTKWVVVGAWLIAVFALSPLGAKLADATKDETASFLPPNAESTKVQNLLKDRFAGGETALGLLLYKRSGGLTAADKARIARDAKRVDQAIPVTQPAQVPFTASAPQGLVSSDGSAAYSVVTVPLDFDKVPDWGKATRDAIGPGAGGLDVYWNVSAWNPYLVALLRTNVQPGPAPATGSCRPHGARLRWCAKD